MTALQQQGQAAKAATYVLATAGTARKNAALNAIADVLTERQTEWLSANAEDVAAAKEAGMRPAMLDRLTLTPERISGIVDANIQGVIHGDVSALMGTGSYQEAPPSEEENDHETNP